MIFKTLTLIGGMFGAAILSQAPEFTQQYMQRLGGQVSALGLVISDFDTSAERDNLSRDEALASMGGTVVLENKRNDMRAAIARHSHLIENQDHLFAATRLQRLLMPHRLDDVPLVKATYNEFRPTLPFTLAGAVSALIGYILGAGVVWCVLAALKWPFRKRKYQSI